MYWEIGNLSQFGAWLSVFGNSIHSGGRTSFCELRETPDFPSSLPSLLHFYFCQKLWDTIFAFLACPAFLALVSENREILFYLVRAYFFIIFFPYRFFVSFPFNLFVLNYFGKKVLAKNFLDKITFLEKLKRLFQIT